MEMEHQAPKVNWESEVPEVPAHFTVEEVAVVVTTAAVEEDQMQITVAPTLAAGAEDRPTQILP